MVPDETSEWKPEMAPQAMVTNRNGKSLPLMIGPPPWTNWRERRELNVRVHHEHADDQNRDRAELHVGGEVIARLQQQPHRQHRSDESVDAHEDGDLVRREGERAGGAGLCHPVSGDHAGDQQNHAEDAGAGDRDFSGVALEHPQAHDERDRDGHADGEHAPRTVRQRVDHHDAQSGQRHQQDEQHGDHRDQSGERADLGARDIGQRAAFVADGGDQHREVLHASGQHGADQQPEKSRRESELRGQRRADQRAGSGDGGEVVSEQHPARRRHVVVTVLKRVSGSGAAIVERQRLGGDERAVVTIREGVNAECTQNDGEGVHRQPPAARGAFSSSRRAWKQRV